MKMLMTKILLSLCLFSTMVFGALESKSLGQFKQEEEKPLTLNVEKMAEETKSSSGWKILLVLAVVGVSGVGTYFLLKLLKKQGFKMSSGSRKYLIENLSYSSIGPGGKAGVGLVKVGSEFMLLGITSNQVTLLSNLPELAKKYEEESRFERSSFKSAVEQELQKIQTKVRISA